MGGAVSITAPKLDEKTIFMKDLVNDEQAIADLFKDITSFGKTNGIMSSHTDFMSLAEILLFVEKEVNPQLSHHYKGMVEMIKESFYYIVGYKKNARLEISLKRFHKFMYAMFMFSHLWKIFAAADDHIDDDSIFLGEFVRAKEKIRHIDGVTFTQEISDEDWKEEFKVIDSGGTEGGNGWISFREFANYCCKAIVSPEEYSKAGGVQRHDEVRYVGPAKPELKQIDFGGAIERKISAVVPSATVRKSSTTSCNGRSNSIQGKLKMKRKPVQFATKEKKRKDVSTIKKRSVKKKSSKKLDSMQQSKSTPVLSNLPQRVDKKAITTDNDENKAPAPYIHSTTITASIKKCSPFIEIETDMESKSIVANSISVFHNHRNISKRILTLDENGDEIDRISPIRPLYRAPSAAEIHQQVSEYRSWAEKATLPHSQCKSWVRSDSAEALSEEVNDDLIPGFGITGIDMVSFEYDMGEAHAEANEHKKYLLRKKKPKMKLWQPKYTKSRFQSDQTTAAHRKVFN